MRRTRRHQSLNGVTVLVLVTVAGGFACWLNPGKGSTAMASPPAISPALPSPPEPAITISAGRGATAPTTEPSTRPTSLASDDPAAFSLARTKIAAGDLTQAREVLNNALMVGMLSDTEATEAKTMITDMNKTLIFSSRRLPVDPWIISHEVEPGEVLAKIGSMNGVTASFLQQINGIADARKMRAGYTIKIVKGPFYAVVTKHAFIMDLYLGAPGGPGSMYVTTYRVGLGTDDSTPTGKWMVEPGKKLPHPTYYPPTGQGPVIEAEDPRNPLGKYWIGLKGIDGPSVGRSSYGIHGTIEPGSIGKQASLGCIRLQSQDVAQVFGLLVEGKSTVVVLP